MNRIMDRICELLAKTGIEPNHITCFKPFFFIVSAIMCYLGLIWMPFLLNIVGWLTDLLDGYYARFSNKVSKKGELLDRLSDKVSFIFLIGTCFAFHKFSAFDIAHLNFLAMAMAIWMCFWEVLGIFLVLYQWKFDPKGKGHGAVRIGKNKLIAQAVFSCAFFAPTTLAMIQPLAIIVSGIIGSALSGLSFWHHIKYVRIKEFCGFLVVNSITLLSMSCGVVALFKAVKLKPQFFKEAILYMFIAFLLDRIGRPTVLRKLKVNGKIGISAIMNNIADFWNFGLVTAVILSLIFYCYLGAFYAGVALILWPFTVLARLIDSVKHNRPTFRGMPASTASLIVLSGYLVFGGNYSPLIFWLMCLSGILVSFWALDIKFEKDTRYKKPISFIFLSILAIVFFDFISPVYLGCYTMSAGMYFIIQAFIGYSE